VENNETIEIISTAMANETSNNNYTVPRNKLLIIIISKQNYTTTSAVTQTNADGENAITLFLRKRATPLTIAYDPFSTNYTISFVPESNVTVNGSTSASTYSLSLPQGSLDASNGTIVEIVFTGVDPASSLDGVPDLVAVEGNETDVRVNLNSLALAEILIQDSTTGQDIALMEPATVTLPLGPTVEASVGDLIEAWSFNVSRGVWVQEGYGVVQEIDGQLVWVYNASHFSWWNCDRPWTDKSCVEVIVSYNSEAPVYPIVDLPVTLSGVPGSFIFSETRNTNATGQVCFNFKRGGTASVTVHSFEKPFYGTTTDPFIGSEEPSVCPGSRDWVPFAESGSEPRCQKILISCDCSCLGKLFEGTYILDLPQIHLLVKAGSQNSVVTNVKDAVRFRLSNGCARKRLLSGHTLTSFRSIELLNLLTLNMGNGDVKTTAAFAAKAEVGQILNFTFEIILSDYHREEEEEDEEALRRCVCGSSHLRVPVSFEVVDSKLYSSMDIFLAYIFS
jgi:hypothetical protein